MKMKRRLFRSGTSLLLVLAMVITNIPNFGLIGKVLANPNPDKVAVEEGQKLPAQTEVEKKTVKTEKQPITYQANEVEIQTPTHAKVEPNFTPPEYEPTVVPEGIVYDEIIEGDQVITDYTTIQNRKVLYTGNVTLKNTLNVNGATVVFGGNLILEKGVFTALRSAAVFVEGEFRIQQQEGEEYKETDAYLYFVGSSKLLIKGDFHTQSTKTSNRVMDLSVLEVGGNFYSLGANTFFSTNTNHQSYQSGKIVFVGREAQHVSVEENIGVYFQNLVVANTESKLHLDTPLNGFSLSHDTTFAGEFVELYGMQMKGFHVNIEGTMVVQKPLYAVVKEGNLFVSGDLRIQSKGEGGTWGETKGYLTRSAGCKLVVQGDVYTQSTNSSNIITNDSSLDIGGNFYSIGSNTFFSTNMNSSTNKSGYIIFAGKGEQHASVEESTGVRLTNLLVANIENKLHLDRPLSHFSLAGDTTFTGEFVELYDMYMNGFNAKVEGNMVVQKSLFLSHESADIYVEGDLRVQSKGTDGTWGETEGSLYIGNSNHFVVEGDFYTQSKNTSNKVVVGATLELRGNLKQIGNTYFGSSWSRGKVAFTGKGEQHVSFDNLEKAATNGESNVTLDLVVANEQGKIYADTPIPHLQLNHDTVIKGNYVELYSMATRDYDLHIEGTYLAQKYRGLLLSSNELVNNSLHERLKFKPPLRRRQKICYVLKLEELPRLHGRYDGCSNSP